MDQLLSMQAVERTGTGMLLRSERCTPLLLKDAVIAMTTHKSYERNARAMRDKFKQIDAAQQFRAFVAETLTSQP